MDFTLWNEYATIGKLNKYMTINSLKVPLYTYIQVLQAIII